MTSRLDTKAAHMSEHARVARWIAANRFPFPDQTDWPPTYITLTNDSGPARGVLVDDIERYPSIVVVDGANHCIAEIGDVVSELDADIALRWSAFSNACKPSSTGAKSFFVYVPDELVEDARRILEQNNISYAGLRGFRQTGETIEITPIVTPGDAKDHR